ncbi:MAG: hypothetical protein V7K38_21855 [Nostoc sp.]|uniref:hypothetical protein n=1 Tax=Nostoc sp. TaxID=1180 RepID=UPI002FF447EE
MQAFIFALTLADLPVISNFIGAMIAEALSLSKQTLGLALHAAGGADGGDRATRQFSRRICRQ